MTIYKPARLFASASQRGFAPTIANSEPIYVEDIGLPVAQSGERNIPSKGKARGLWQSADET